MLNNPYLPSRKRLVRTAALNAQSAVRDVTRLKRWQGSFVYVTKVRNRPARVVQQVQLINTRHTIPGTADKS